MARKILLADDSVTAQNMGRRILSDAGYEVITVNNGAAALKKIAELKPDLIILDVYMPGYSGLEVCQRVKESSETSRIPVLLTVGKMEPFKADEAKKARADNFIIKPFEASELLTALAKLEDKIVPLPENKKPVRGKTTAATQTSVAKGAAADSEWKNRLKIPPPPDVRLEEATKVREKDSGADESDRGFRDLSGKERDVKTAKISETKTGEAATSQERSEEKSNSGKEITHADIAEMVSAAASNGGASSKVPEAEAKDVESAEASKAKPSYEEEPGAVTFASAPVESEVAALQAGSAEVQAAESARVASEEIAATEAEVTAVLASLVPTQTNVEEPVFASHANANGSSQGSELAQSGNSGPRWTVHSVPLSESEALVSLQLEMEKALALQVANEPVNSDKPTAEETASMMNELLSVVAQAEVSSANTVDTSGDRDSNSENGAMPGGELSSQDAASSAEMKSSEDDQGAAPESVVDAVQAVSSQEAMSSEAVSEAAFAAAASVGATTYDLSPNGNATADLPVEKQAIQIDCQRETELAAAWQNWKQIRETIAAGPGAAKLTSEPDVPASEAVNEDNGDAGFKDIRPKAVARTEEIQAEAENSDDAIASIVDSVLANLKPKLMEEIARKMAQEKK